MERDVLAAERGGRAAIDRRQERRLTALIALARRRSPLYRDLYAGLPRRVALPDVPVVEKKLLMDRFDEWLTDRRVRRDDVEAFVADPERIGEPYVGEYLVTVSSGTSGLRGLTLRDRRTLRVAAALMRSRGTSGVPPPRRPTRGGPVYLSFTDGPYAMYAGWRFGRLQGRPGGGHFISLATPISRIVEELNDYDPRVVSSTPSLLAELAEQQLAGALRIYPHLVRSGGETLTEQTRTRIEAAFECPLRDAYTATESRYIALSCAHGWLHVNEDWVVVEPVDEERRPVAPGVASHSVLLTDLANRVQPLIRYDIRDSITVRPDPCECGSPFRAIRVAGRTREILRLAAPDGSVKSLHPGVLDVALDVPQVLRYQVVVGDGEMRVRMDLDETSDAAQLWPARLDALRRALDHHGLGFVRVEQDAAPPEFDPGSEKYRRVVTAG